jgi:enoyl-CoA hydratase
MYGPEEAVRAGFLDEIVPSADLLPRSAEIARSLLKVDRNAHRETKKRLRASALGAIRAAIESELAG